MFHVIHFIKWKYWSFYDVFWYFIVLSSQIYVSCIIFSPVFVRYKCEMMRWIANVSTDDEFEAKRHFTSTSCVSKDWYHPNDWNFSKRISTHLIFFCWSRWSNFSYNLTNALTARPTDEISVGEKSFRKMEKRSFLWNISWSKKNPAKIRWKKASFRFPCFFC